MLGGEVVGSLGEGLRVRWGRGCSRFTGGGVVEVSLGEGLLKVRWGRGVVEGSLEEGLLKVHWEEGTASYSKLGWEMCLCDGGVSFI